MRDWHVKYVLLGRWKTNMWKNPDSDTTVIESQYRATIVIGVQLQELHIWQEI